MSFPGFKILCHLWYIMRRSLENQQDRPRKVNPGKVAMRAYVQNPSGSVPSIKTRLAASFFSSRSQPLLEVHLSPRMTRGPAAWGLLCPRQALPRVLLEVSTGVLQRVLVEVIRVILLILVQVLIKVISVCKSSGLPEIQHLLVS